MTKKLRYLLLGDSPLGRISPVMLVDMAEIYTLKLFPPGALIIEQVDLSAAVSKPRSLVLWMDKPVRNIRDSSAKYGCTERTAGNYFSGPTRVTLVDLKKGVVVNTLRVLSGKNVDQDTFSIPFLIKRFYYYVPFLDGTKQGKPEILNIADYNGNGVAAEFVLYDSTQQDCGVVNTALLGYDGVTDSVMQYSFEFPGENGQLFTSRWALQVFATKPTSPGQWDFKWSYGHGHYDSEVHEQIYFDRTRRVYIRNTSISTLSSR